MLRAEEASFAVGKKILLNKTSIAFEAGLFHVVMGANGAGKSTLLNLLAGEQKPTTGAIFLGNKNLQDFSKLVLATKRAVLSQHYHISFPIAVNDVVRMGRYPYYGNNPSADDLKICKIAMQQLDVAQFGERDYGTLSGGEAQKVQMSRVLAQIGSQNLDEKILFLDEPVSHLDIKYQHQLLKAAKELCKKGVTVIAVLHDVNLSLQFADRLLLMKDGKVVYKLTEASELTPEIIKKVFDVDSSILLNADGKPIVIF